MVWYALLLDIILMEDVLRCIVMENGGQCVRRGFILLMPTQSANSLDTILPINTIAFICKLLFRFSVLYIS